MHHVHAGAIYARRKCQIPGTGGCEMPTWMLGTELGASARTVDALNDKVVSPALGQFIHFVSSVAKFCDLSAVAGS